MTFNTFRYTALAGFCGALTVIPGTAIAQGYPTKPIRFIVGYAAGGGTDVMARGIASQLPASLKQRVIVENRPGANANLAAEYASRQAADGYLVLFISVSHAMSKSVYSKLGYDIERDFMPITIVSEVSNVLAAHPSLPARTVREVIALAKAKPGELTYASSGVGSPEHFAGEMFKMMTGVNMLMVPYKGGGPIAIDLVAGHVMTSFSTMPPIIPHVRSGRVRAIAVTKARRAAVLPDVPTIAESGVPGYAMSTWYGCVVRTGTPQEIVNQLNAAVINALADPKVRKHLENLGAEIVGSNVADSSKFLKSEIAKYAKVAKAANIHAN